MKRIVISVLAILLLCFPIILVNASQVETAQVSAMSSSSWVINLSDGDSFSGSLSVSGGSGNDIDFSITDPQGTTIVNSGRVSQGTTFDFTVEQSGAYTFHLGNAFSIFSSKTVSMSYDVTHPMLGGTTGNSYLIPILAIIVIVIVVVVLAVVLTRKKGADQSFPPPPPPP
jgi:hypothetical protein